MRRSAFLVLLVVLGTACGRSATGGGSPASAASPAGSPIDAAALGLVLPTTVRTYRLTESNPVEGHPGHRGFRYSNGSTTLISVFVYPADSGAALAEPREVVAKEGPLFSATLPLGVQRGWYDAYTMAFAHADSLTVDGRMLFGHVTGAATKRANRVDVEFQYLYLVGTRFVKVRASVPAEGWQNTDVPLFAKELAGVLARQLRSPR